MIKNILVHADSDARRQIRLDTAMNLAKRHDARVTALFTLHYPYELPNAVLNGVDESILEQAGLELHKVAERVQDEFAKTARENDVRLEWRREYGAALSLLAMHARYADLVVVSQPPPETQRGADNREMPGQLALAAGRPLLVIPFAGDFNRIGDRVLVAWNGSREAARAVYDALPILREASSVTVLGVNPDDDKHLPGADISAHLASHGVAVEASRTDQPDVRPGEGILNEATNIGADLIVMGAYGHSPFRESLLGGVTWDLLHHMTVPVLLSH